MVTNGIFNLWLPKLLGSHTFLTVGVKTTKTGRKKHTKKHDKTYRGRPGQRKCINNDVLGLHVVNNPSAPTTITGDIQIEMNIQGEVLATCEDEKNTHFEKVELPILDDLSNCLTDINKNSLLDTHDITYL